MTCVNIDVDSANWSPKICFLKCSFLHQGKESLVTRISYTIQEEALMSTQAKVWFSFEPDNIVKRKNTASWDAFSEERPSFLESKRFKLLA